MKKIVSILGFVFLLLVLINSFVYAADDINMNLTTNNFTSNETGTNTSVPAPTTNTSTNNSTSANISSITSLPEASLGLSNILNILLVVVGVLLVLLSIAILIRLKNK